MRFLLVSRAKGRAKGVGGPVRYPVGAGACGERTVRGHTVGPPVGDRGTT
jgi:hypothetical protein